MVLVGKSIGVEWTMEIVVSVGMLIVFAVLAACFGADSRDQLRSHEAELAALGFVRERQDLWKR